MHIYVFYNNSEGSIFTINFGTKHLKSAKITKSKNCATMCRVTAIPQQIYAPIYTPIQKEKKQEKLPRKNETVEWRGGGLGSSTIFKKFNEPYAPS